jgi:signal-transduction protein with cAMP-binding, CBS, and nucleotidyltransferase domain
MEKITDVLGRNNPQFNTITSSASVKDAIYKMYCENVDYLIVLEQEKFIGILTEHDITSKVLFQDKPLQQMHVKEFVTAEVPVVTAENSLEYAMQVMEHHHARHLAVYDGFTFQGVVSAQDLMRQTLKKRQSAFENNNDTHAHSWDY